MTPAEELRAAATKLRETASRATSGPWSASAVWSPRSPSTSAVYSYAHPTGTDRSEVIPSMQATPKRPLVRPGDAEWIALASPALAEPLALRLEEAARQCDLNEYRAPRHRFDPASDLTVARAINGDPR